MIITYDEYNGVVSLRKTSLKEKPYDSIHIEYLVKIWQKSTADTLQTAQQKIVEFQKLCGIKIDPDRMNPDCGWK